MWRKCGWKHHSVRRSFTKTTRSFSEKNCEADFGGSGVRFWCPSTRCTASTVSCLLPSTCFAFIQHSASLQRADKRVSWELLNKWTESYRNLSRTNTPANSTSGSRSIWTGGAAVQGSLTKGQQKHRDIRRRHDWRLFGNNPVCFRVKTLVSWETSTNMATKVWKK